jgi:PilZ domain-containing protein
MEHRRSSRKPLRERIGLDTSRSGAALSAYTRDVSLGGMFVETRSLVLPPNTSVTVSFDLGNSGEVHTFHLNATVVRRAPEGLGLMFLQMEPDVIRTLSNALARHH